MTEPLPLQLASSGWELLGPSMTFSLPKGCAAQPPGRGCKQDGACVGHDACSRCECYRCAACARAVTRWRSPRRKILHAVSTNTQPRFTFAYNPLDDDMDKMATTLVTEPMLTFAWHEATWRCCAAPGGLVVDIGANYGWFALYSLALGCDVVAFEPVPEFQEALQLGISLNPGFAQRARLYGNVVYDTPGTYSLRVPIVEEGHPHRKMGMTGMRGSAGVLKKDAGRAYQHAAASVRVDDLVQRDTCLLKADVEGYEPQAIHTAARLLATRRVDTLQFELTHTNNRPNQTCAAVRMLAGLHALGFEMRQVRRQLKDSAAPPVGTWRTAPGLWDKLPRFPSGRERLRVGKRRGGGSNDSLSIMRQAWKADFSSFSTNIIARRAPESVGARAWPQFAGSPCIKGVDF
jgi:FkbM family methyltransferase